MLFLPDGTPEQMRWYDDLLRHSASAEMAARLYERRGSLDVVEFAPQVSAKSLVVHARDDRVVPAEEGRLLASLVPGAELTLLESANHILLADEPAWPAFLSKLSDFLGTEEHARTGSDDLSPRELEVLELVAAGLTNEAIAARLVLSVRTVERHLSNVYAKLGVSGKAGRAAAAARFSELRAASSPLG
jgi:DNA-binding NarL/FixJ family response regulator